MAQWIVSCYVRHMTQIRLTQPSDAGAIAEVHARSVHVVESEAGELLAYGSAGQARQCGLDYDGELYTLYFVPNHRRGSLGWALLRAMFGRLWRASSTTRWAVCLQPSGTSVI